METHCVSLIDFSTSPSPSLATTGSQSPVCHQGLGSAGGGPGGVVCTPGGRERASERSGGAGEWGVGSVLGVVGGLNRTLHFIYM